jgi:hypothetical protein
MQRKNRSKVSYQDKVVFVLNANSQNRNTPKSEETYEYVRSMIEVMLRKSNVTTDRVFVGGGIRDICMWVGAIFEFYQFKEIEIKDNTFKYKNDADFDLPSKLN